MSPILFWTKKCKNIRGFSIIFCQKKQGFSLSLKSPENDSLLYISYKAEMEHISSYKLQTFTFYQILGNIKYCP